MIKRKTKRIKTSNRVPLSFFERKTELVARDLIGKYLVRKVGDELIRERITEAEAYVGPHDLACHASRGKTERTKILWDKAGTIYVYFIYGMHWMLNIVTEEKGYPSAVLIRETEGAHGPGILTKKFKIDKELNGKKLGNKTGLWIESDLKIENRKFKISKLPRIGVSYAGPVWSKKLYRFRLRD